MATLIVISLAVMVVGFGFAAVLGRAGSRTGRRYADGDGSTVSYSDYGSSGWGGDSSDCSSSSGDAGGSDGGCGDGGGGGD